ncbi:MAG: hypothetical protein WAW88_13675 [Nocardioides sp.]
MTGSSTIYTMGTALNLAHSNGATVEVLVEGHWIIGRVASIDSHGVVLTTDGLDHSIVRLDKITAINVKGAARNGQHRAEEYARESGEARVASLPVS